MFMVCEGVFDDVDAVFIWHLEVFVGMFNICMLVNIQVLWCFKGIAVYVVNFFYLGCSVFDVVMLMIIGINFFNEYIIEKVCVYYVIINSGGILFNVVQVQVEVFYFICVFEMIDVQYIYDWVVKIVEGAVLMIEIMVECCFDKVCFSYFLNCILENVMYQVLFYFGILEWNFEELVFVK